VNKMLRLYATACYHIHVAVAYSRSILFTVYLLPTPTLIKSKNHRFSPFPAYRKMKSDFPSVGKMLFFNFSFFLLVKLHLDVILLISLIFSVVLLCFVFVFLLLLKFFFFCFLFLLLALIVVVV